MSLEDIRGFLSSDEELTNVSVIGLEQMISALIWLLEMKNHMTRDLCI